MPEFKIASAERLIPEATVQLPSQKDTEYAVKLQKPALLKLLYEGELINLLMPLVREWTNGTLPQSDSNDEIEIVLSLIKAVPELEPYVNKVVQATMVEPALNEQTTEKLPVRDRIFVAMWAMEGEFGDIRAMFRGFQRTGSNVQPLGAIPTVGDSAGGAARSAGSMGGDAAQRGGAGVGAARGRGAGKVQKGKPATDKAAATPTDKNTTPASG